MAFVAWFATTGESASALKVGTSSIIIIMIIIIIIIAANYH